jgi:hypothetical protein
MDLCPAACHDRAHPAPRLADNVTDHRLNSRAVYMNPLSRFID